MILEHEGRVPVIHPTAYVAPTATICGDVSIGPHSSIGFGAVLTADGGSIRIGAHCVIREQSVIRALHDLDTVIGDHTLVGPHTYLVGCRIGASAFLATGAIVFHGAEVGDGAEVRVHGIVHVRTRLPSGTAIPIGWIAVGDPATILPPERHEEIWAILEPLNFPNTAYGIDRPASGGMSVADITEKVSAGLLRHRNDRVLHAGAP